MNSPLGISPTRSHGTRSRCHTVATSFKSNANSKNTSPLSNKGRNGLQKHSLDSPSLMSQANLKRTIVQVDNFAKGLLSDMVEVDRHIYNQNLPYHKYYDQHTKKLMSQTEIVKVIEKNYDFFQASPSLFRGSEYRPKDFYFCCPPKSKGNNERSARVKIIKKTPSENLENRYLRTEGQIMHKTEPSIDTNIQHLVPKPYYTKEGKFLAETEGTIRGTPSRSTQAGSYFDTPSSTKEISSRERLTTAPLERIDEKVSLVEYGKDKIPSSLYQGTLRRKELLAKLQRGRDQEDPLDNKSVRSTQILKKNLSTRKLKQAKGAGISIDTSRPDGLEFLSNSSKDKGGLVSKLRATVSSNIRMKAL